MVPDNSPGNAPDAPADRVTLEPQAQSVLARLAGPDGVVRADADINADRYTVLEEIGKGGMGVVFKARDGDLRRDVAMKVLHAPDTSLGTPSTAGSDPRQLARFLEEAQVTGQLDHPGIVPIHELGLDRNGRVFFTMRLVRGRTLGQIFELVQNSEESWTVTRALGVIQKVCEAMAYAHHKQVIHRDIKPSNIMVGRFGESYVMDWGLAKVVDEHAPAAPVEFDQTQLTRSLVHTDRKDMADSSRSSPLATLEGDIVGTPAYMAPEQAMGHLELLGPRTDIYSVGALLYQLLTGQPPYIKAGTKASPAIVLAWVIDGPPTPVRQLAPKVPDELVAICEKAMAREPSQRYASMLEIAEDVQAFIEDRVVHAYQTGAWAEFRKWVSRNKGLAASLLLAVGLALVGLGGVSWVQTQAKTELASKNTQLASTNAALEAATAEATEARDAALANEERALASEREALDQSYVANVTAASAALENGSAEATRRYLESCDESLRGWEWAHLNLRSDTSLARTVGHGSLIWDVKFSPDGQTFATASGPLGGWGGQVREARIWDAETGELIQTVGEHASPVTAVAYNHDGTRLATGGADGRLRVWDLERNTLIGVPQFMGDVVTDVHYSADGAKLAAGAQVNDGETGRVVVRNVRNFDIELDVETPSGVRSLAISPDARWVAAGGLDHTIRIWELPSGRLDRTWEIPGSELIAEATVTLNGVVSLDFSPDGRLLAVASSDRRVRAWDLQTNEIVYSLATVRGAPSSARFSPDGRWLVVGDESGALQFFEPRTGQAMEVLNGHNQFLTALDFSPDGSRIATCSWDRTARVWEGRPGSAVTLLPTTADTGGGPPTTEIVFAPDGRRVAWRPNRWTLHMSDAWSGETLYTVLGIRGSIGAVAFSADGRRLIVVSEIDGLLTFDVGSGDRISGPTEALGYPERVAYDPDLTLFALVPSNRDTVIELRSTEDGRLIHTLEGHKRGVAYGSFTPDGRRFVSPSWDGTLRIWDVERGELLKTFDTEGSPWKVAISPDGKTAVTSAFDLSTSGLTWWDLETGEKIRHHPGRSTFLNFAPNADFTRFASSNVDGTLGVWDFDRGELLHLAASDLPMTNVAFSPDGQRIAGIDGRGQLRVWETVHPRERNAARAAAARRTQLADEVRPLLEDFREELLFTSDVVNRLADLPSMDEEVRSAAIQSVRAEGDVPYDLLNLMWDVVLDGDRTDGDYVRILKRATRASDMWPGFRGPLSIAGATMYRLDRPVEALEVLNAADAVRWSFRPAGPRFIYLWKAMALHDLGDEGDSLFQLKRARDHFDARSFNFTRAERERFVKLLEEATAHIEGDD